MKHWRAILVFAFFLAAASWLAVSQTAPPRVLVLEDFETPESAARWEGPLQLSQDHASHGISAGRVRLDQAHNQFSSTKLASDWSGYDRLLFDVYTDRKGNTTATIRIFDSPRESSDARNKIFLQEGWNHVEILLTPLKAASFERDIDLHHVSRLLLLFDAGPLTIYVDNFRLVAGEEGKDTQSRLQPQDTVTSIDNRWVTVRQVARPEDVPEAPFIDPLRRQAEREVDLLRKTIQAAQTQGIDTIYLERHLVTADLGLRVRPLLAWYNNDQKKQEMFSYVAQSCRRARQEIEDSLRGLTLRREVDDTQLDEPLVRPLPPLKGRPIHDSFFLDDRGEPMMVLSAHSPSKALQRFFASPLQHIESYSVGGGSRWTIDESPVYKAFHQDPDTHRVGWDGWCGHLVRDLSSMGGTKKENVVVCLESPHIKKAVSEYIQINTPKFHANPELLYDIMAYELMYICYCDRSKSMFHQWLEKKYSGQIGNANECWGTRYGRFNEVIPPSVKNSRPLDGTNRGLWYDWARFNQDRFTDYLLWVRDEIHKIDPRTPLAAGGSSSMLAGRTGTTGIDEERIVNEVDDVIIHEGSGSTLGMDLQRALSEKKKPLADPEMSLRGVQFLLPHFLHGKSVAQLFHWPAQPGNEFHSNNQSSLAHSWNISLADVDEVLRVALDVRRLNKEIAAFADAPAEVAILYSQTSTLQLPPEMLTWQTTPYLTELRRAYEASQYLDAKVTFVTERQIRKGQLSRYKLLLVPGVRNIPSAVVQSMWEYASQGGRVLIAPESLLADEYNRPAQYLSNVGISIRKTDRPKPAAQGRMTQGYDQSFSQNVTYVEDTPQKLQGNGDLTVRGVRQTIQADAKAEVTHRYPGGAPAIVRIPMGKGAVDYTAGSLDEESYARFLEALFTQAGVSRPVRLRAVSGSKGKIESRIVQLGSRRLIYVVNFNAAPVRLTVDTKLERMQELRAQQVIRGNEITVPARQTSLYEIF